MPFSLPNIFTEQNHKQVNKKDLMSNGEEREETLMHPD